MGSILKKTVKYLDPREDKILNTIKKVRIKSNKFLFFHLPVFIFFFGFLYIFIPTFYNYENLTIQRIICKSSNIVCKVQEKVSYNFFPTPRLKVKDLRINLTSDNGNLLVARDVSLKLSLKNLLAKDKHKVKKIVITDFESNINLKKLNSYNNIFHSHPIFIRIQIHNGFLQSFIIGCLNRKFFRYFLI